MSMDVGGAKGGVKSDINVTPLVDVMLVLLIIMMLVAPMLQKGVDVKLPQAANTTDKPETQGQTVVGIQANKQIFLNSVPVRPSDLSSRVADLMANATEKVVLIKADEDVDYGTVMETMDNLRSAGVEDMGLITDRKCGGRQLMTTHGHAHKHFGAEDNVKAKKLAGQRRHERHADDRRAARAARHLHGGPAADAEGPRHQPAGRNAAGAAAAGRQQPDRARDAPPTARCR